jgi:hypothetical protein
LIVAVRSAIPLHGSGRMGGGEDRPDPGTEPGLIITIHSNITSFRMERCRSGERFSASPGRRR